MRGEGLDEPDKIRLPVLGLRRAVLGEGLSTFLAFWLEFLLYV